MTQNMKPEKTQKGNPHKLTVNQHCFPARSIERFTNEEGLVSVVLLKQKKTIHVKSTDQIFCANRAWDQRVENSFMKRIEDQYQEIAESILSGAIKEIDTNMRDIVTNMYALWNTRVQVKSMPVPDVMMNALGLEVEYTKDEQEELEKNQISFARPDLSIPGRQLAGLHIQNAVSSVRKQMSDANWGVLKSARGEFIIPDCFVTAPIIPLTPSLCLCYEMRSQTINYDQVQIINKLALDSAKDYYFARDLNTCPLPPRSI